MRRLLEQFGEAARQVVVRAQAEARDFGHGWVGTEHLLLGVLAQPGVPAVNALAELGLTLDSARVALAQTVGRGDVLGTSEADALRTVGIDLEQVRNQVEAAFGPGALDHPARYRHSRRVLPWRAARRCEARYRPGYLPLRPRAEKALERSRREATELGDRQIRVEHVLLGLLDPRGNMAVQLVRHVGANPGAVRVRVLNTMGKAA